MIALWPKKFRSELICLDGLATAIECLRWHYGSSYWEDEAEELPEEVSARGMSLLRWVVEECISAGSVSRFQEESKCVDFLKMLIRVGEGSVFETFAKNVMWSFWHHFERVLFDEGLRKFGWKRVVPIFCTQIGTYVRCL